jgi:hypothetical protein
MIPSPRNVTVRKHHQEETLSPTIGLLAEEIMVTRSGRMSGSTKRTGNFTIPLPDICDDKSDHAIVPPISISSGSSPGTPKDRNSTFTLESPTLRKLPPQTRKALVFVLAQTRFPTQTLPAQPRAHKNKDPEGSLTAEDVQTLALMFCQTRKAPAFVLAQTKFPAQMLPAQPRAHRSKVPEGSLAAKDVQTPALMLPQPAPALTTHVASLMKKNCRVAKRKPIQAITVDDVEAAKARSVSRIKKTRSVDPEPPTPGSDPSIPHQSTPTQTHKLVLGTQKYATVESNLVAPHAGDIQVQSRLHGRDDGHAVTNNFYLMAMDPFAAGHIQTRDAGYDRITSEINNLLAGHRVSSTMLEEIWMGIYQARGYEPECWMANLAKNGIPEELFGPMLQIMTAASADHHKTQW